MNPSVGRIVHYLCKGNHHAAIITRINDFSKVVNLHAFDTGDDDSILETSNIKHVIHDDKAEEDGTWHWPERVE